MSSKVKIITKVDIKNNVTPSLEIYDNHVLLLEKNECVHIDKDVYYKNSIPAARNILQKYARDKNLMDKYKFETVFNPNKPIVSAQKVTKIERIY